MKSSDFRLYRYSDSTTYCFIVYYWRNAEIRATFKISALVVGIVFFILCMGFYVKVVGQEFHSAVGFPSVLERLHLPGNSMNLFTGIIAPTPILNVLMQIGNLMWFLLVPYVIIQVCTHNVVAWTTDQLIPEYFNKRSKKTNAPWVASLVVCALALLCVIVNYFFGVSLIGAVALAAVAFFLTGVSAYRLPSINSDAFSRAPQTAQREFMGVTFFQIVGGLSAIGFVWILYAAVVYPQVSGGTSLYAILDLCVVYGLGLIVYGIGKGKLKQIQTQTGINLDALFKEIPQD